MSRLKDLSTVKQSPLDHFVYTPPLSAYNAARVLLFVNLGYAIGANPAVNWGTVSAVLRGIRRVTPRGRILIVDKICPVSAAQSIFERLGLPNALDNEMRIAPLDDLIMTQYKNPLQQPYEQSEFSAPAYLSEFDSVIIVTSHADQRAGISYLSNLLPCSVPTPKEPQSGLYHDLFSTFGSYIHSTIVEVTKSPSDIQIIWGEDLLSVDKTACAGTSPEYLKNLHKKV